MKKYILTLCLLAGMTAAASAQKFAMVDMEYIMKNIPSYEAAEEQLNQISKKWQSEVETQMQEVEQLYKNYQTELVFLSEVYTALQEITKEEGYDLVFDRSSAMPVIIASPKLDISDDVLQKLGYSK